MIQPTYCTMETAELLRSAGFPQENGGATKYYLPDRTLFSYQYADYSQDIAAPTHAQAMRWLRDEKNLSVEPVWHHGSPRCLWMVVVTEIDPNPDILIESKRRYIENTFLTYESAAERGIIEACRWLIEKGGER